MKSQLFEYHPIIGYHYIPNLQTRIQHESGGYLLRTNGLGFRSEIEFKLRRNGNCKRILLFGDSYTAGDGVSNKKRYSDLLMQILPSTEVYNFGVSGTGTDQQYLIYKEYAENIEHDLVMIVVFVENIRRVNANFQSYVNDKNEQIVYQKPYFELNDKELILRNTPVNPNQLKFDDLSEFEKSKSYTGGRFPRLKEFVEKAGYKDLLQKITRYQPLPEYKSTPSKDWEVLKSILLKWISELKKPILLVPLPLYHYVEDLSEYKYIEGKFRGFNNVKNVTVYHPLEDLKKYTKKERRKFRFEQDIHLSPLGHEAYAKALKPKIMELL